MVVTVTVFPSCTRSSTTVSPGNAGSSGCWMPSPFTSSNTVPVMVVPSSEPPGAVASRDNGGAVAATATVTTMLPLAATGKLATALSRAATVNRVATSALAGGLLLLLLVLEIGG